MCRKTLGVAQGKIMQVLASLAEGVGHHQEVLRRGDEIYILKSCLYRGRSRQKRKKHLRKS